MQNEFANVRRVLGYGVDNRIAKRLSLLVPRAVFQIVGRVLNKARHYVLARRRHRRISQTGYYDVDVWPPGVATVLGVVVSALHVVDAGTNRYRAAQVWTNAGQALQIRQTVKRKIHLARRASIFVALKISGEIRRQVFLANHLHEGKSRIDA